jgi:16S rRNA (adenine1518-N6/adenine1519-N6)-dimethyltransferase
MTTPEPGAALLGAADVRALAARYDIRPTKQRGQNFVIDANTVRRIVALANVDADDVVIEVGPGLGSLTLALLPAVHHVIAIEIDQALAAALPQTVADRAPTLASRLTVRADDALVVVDLQPAPTAVVANLPYNVSVPVLLHLLEQFPSIDHGLVMVQAEVADRLAALPGSRVYGIPSVKAAWYADVRRVGTVGAGVFWPAPRVESGLVSLRRRPPPRTRASRPEVFAVVDAAFAQRRKTLRSALATWAGSAAASESALRAAGIDPGLRGEQLDVAQFARLAEERVARTGP